MATTRTRRTARSMVSPRNGAPRHAAGGDIGVIAARLRAIVIDLTRRAGRRGDDRRQIGVGIGIDRLRIVVPGIAEHPPPAGAVAMASLVPVAGAPDVEIAVVEMVDVAVVPAAIPVPVVAAALRGCRARDAGDERR